MNTENPKIPGMSRQQRVAILLLSIILLLALTFWRLLPTLKKPDTSTEQQELARAWQDFEAHHLDTIARPVKYTRQQYDDSRYEHNEGPKVATNMALFDPNTADEEQLLALGLPLRTVRTLIKYRSKGGRFYSPEDLGKLYTLSKEDYERILPYARVAETKRKPQYASYEQDEEPSNYETKTYPKPAEYIDLNKADAATLMSLRGIGPGYSSRIIQFREKSGGFYKVEQLKDVRGFPDSTYQQLKDRFIVNPDDIKKIAINFASESELANHPYIGKRLAAHIIKLRNDLQRFTEIEQLRQTPLINEEKYRKIAPYLSL